MLEFAQSLSSQLVIQALKDDYNIEINEWQDDRPKSGQPRYYVSPTDKALVLYRPSSYKTDQKQKLDAVKAEEGHGLRSRNEKWIKNAADTSSCSPINFNRAHAVKKEEDSEGFANLSLETFEPKPESQAGSNISTTSNEPFAGCIVRSMKWNMPGWGHGGDGAYSYPIAAADSIRNRPPTHEWNSVKRQGRCVVFCDGYYAVRKASKRRPETTCFVRYADRRVMLLAGLYFHNEEDTIPYRFCLISQERFKYPITVTTEREGKVTVTPKLKALKLPSDRGPIILSTPEDVATWLDTTSKRFESKHMELLEPRYDLNRPLIWYEVPMGKVNIHVPGIMDPASDPEDDGGASTESDIQM